MRRVEAMESRVDLPAPFGPSRATISPALNRNDTLLRTRRRPKWRETSVNVSERKSIGGALRSRLLVHLRVDAFERRDQFAASRRVALWVDRILAMLFLEGRELREQTIPRGVEPPPPLVVGRRFSQPRASPGTGGKNHHGQDERQVAGPHGLMRKSGKGERHSLSRSHGGAFRDNEGFALKR